MLGVSVFLGQQEEKTQFDYLSKMKMAGFSIIFTSLHIPEDNQDTYHTHLKKLGNQAMLLGMDLLADISPQSLLKLGLTFENAHLLKEWGVTGLRVDYGISDDIIVSLSKTLKIALNASTLTEELIQNLINQGLEMKNVEAWHNYYPRKETGLGRDAFIEKNKRLQKIGLKVMAFIPGDHDLRGPIYASLPTLEDHRNISPFIAALEMKKCYVDITLIGDKSIKEETLHQFIDYSKGSIPIRCSVDDSSIHLKERILQKHKNRMDSARDVIRSETSRMYATKGKIIEPVNTVHRGVGSITIDNKHYGRYSGELQITLRDLEVDSRVNVVGQVNKQDLPLLNYIGAGQEFHFIIK